MRKFYGSACVLGVVGTGLAFNSFLTDFRWQNAVNGNWSSATAWDPDGVPNGAGNSALIDATGANYTVTINQNVTDLSSLTVDSANATVSASGIAFSAAAININDGRVVLNSATFTTTGGLLNAGMLDTYNLPVVNGNFTSLGTLSVLGYGTHTNFTAQNGLTSLGTLNLDSSGGGYSATLTVNGGILTNGASGTMNLLTGAGGPRNIVADFNNLGVLNISAASNLLRNGATTTNTGTINIAANGSLSLAQPSSLFKQDAGSLTVNGSLVVSGGADFEFNGGTISGLPWISNASLIFGPSSSGAGVFNINGSSTLAGNIGGNQGINIWGNGVHTTVTAANGFTNNGLIEMESAGGGYATQITVSSGILTNNGTIRTKPGNGGARVIAGDLMNHGTLEFNQGTTFSRTNGIYTNMGQMTSPTLAVMSGSNQVFNQSGGTMDLTNGGFNITSATFNFDGGTIIGRPNLISSALLITGTGSGAVASIGGGTISGTIGANKSVTVWGAGVHTTMSSSGFVNNGALIMDSSGGGYSANISATTGTIVNNGSLTTLAGNGGARTIAGDFTNTGTMSINQPTNFSKTAGVYTNQGGSINLLSSLSYSGANQVFNQNSGPISGGDNFFVSNATFNFNGGTISGKPFLVDATLNIGGGATGLGAFRTSGTSVMTGNVRAATTIHIQGNSTGSHTVLTSPSAYSNAGSMLMDSISGGYNVTLAVTAGLLTNIGNLTVNPGSGGSRTIAGSFVNNGTMNFNAATLLSKTSGTFTNGTGTMDMTQQVSMIGSGQSFNLDGGSISGGSNLLVQSASLNFNGGTLDGEARVLAGTLNIGSGANGSAGFMTMSGSTITGDIKAATTVRNQGNPSGSHATLTAPAAFSNAGSMIFDSVGGGYQSNLTVNTGVLSNSGSFTVNPGSGGGRTIAANLTNTGTVTINASTTFQKTSAVIENAGGTFTAAATTLINANSQTFRQSGGTLAAGANLLQLSVGTFHYTGGTITGTPYLGASTLNIAGSATNSANFRVGGASALVGNILNGHEVWVNGNGGNSHASLTSTNGFSNAGTLRLESSDGGYNSIVNVTTGNMVVQPSGKVLIQPGTGGGRSITCTLQNNGLVEFNTGASVGRAGATNSNGGTLRVTGNNTATIVGSTFNSFGGGRIEGVGTVVMSGFTNGGTVAPGLPAPADQTSKLTVSGTHTQNALGAIDVDLAGFDQGSTYDWYAATGAVALDGRLVVRLLENFDPATGSEFTVITAPSITGTFSSLQLDKFPPNKSAEVIYSATSVKVRIKDGIRVNADSYLVTIGEEFQGNLNSLFTTDNNSLSLFPDPVSQFAQIEITGTATVSTPIAIRFSFEGRVERLGIAQATQMFNYTNNNWVFIDSRVGTTQDSAFDSNIGVNAPQFVGPAGIIKARVTWQPINDEDPTQDGWLHAIDVATWTLTE